MEMTINAILIEMQPVLGPAQLKQLTEVLRRNLRNAPQASNIAEIDLLALFLTAKEVEGCSQRTLDYYRSTLERARDSLSKPYEQMSTDDLREYLTGYERERGAGKVTIDNIRRIMSSFFGWLEDEDYIVKSPVRRIRKVKTIMAVKETLSDEELEALRDGCESERDLAIVDMLSSTGMRVGELVRLNRGDVDFHERECLVMGKGNKQRMVYFDARTKLHLQSYLQSRTDDNPALFVSLANPQNRVTIGCVEMRLRSLGRKLNLSRVHPHKLRRTTATHAIEKGMPIEQVQKMLGHSRIDTTMHYAMVNQKSVKASHRKYLE